MKVIVTPKLAQAQERQFPILYGSDERKQYADLPSVPWSLLVPHEQQALANHQQSLEKLASRGGLHPTETMAILMDKPFYKSTGRPNGMYDYNTIAQQRTQLTQQAVAYIKQQIQKTTPQVSPVANNEINDGPA